MSVVIFNLVIVAIAALSVVRGFNRGVARQTSKALGCAFGIVGARVFGPQLAEGLEPTLLWLPAFDPGARFVVSTMAAVIPFTIGYFLLWTLGLVLNFAMRVFPVTTLGKIAGSIMSLFNAILWISVILNLLLCRGARTALLESACAGDGNVIEEVMLIAPALLGSQNYDDLHHAIQLEEAKKISRLEGCDIFEPTIVIDNKTDNRYA